MRLVALLGGLVVACDALAVVPRGTKGSLRSQAVLPRARAAVGSLSGGEQVLRPERALQPLSFIFVLSVAIVALAPAPALISELGSERATRLLSGVGSASAACEIVLAPIVGALADSYGRKPVLLGVLGAVLCSNGFAFANPTSTAAILATKFVGSLVVGLYFLAAGAMLGDAYKTKPGQLAASSGVLYALVNVGFAAGIKMSSLVPGGGSLRPLYAVATAASLASVCFAAATVRETNPERVPYTLRSFNPLGCVRLFRNGREMRLLAILLALTLQPIFMGDVLQIFAIDQWKLSQAQIATFFTIIPVMGAVGNVAGGRLVKAIGLQAFTAIATLSNFGFWVGCSLSHRAALIAATVGFLGPARTLGASASLTAIAGKKGIPQGQLSGDRANLIAILKILGPTVYGQLYVRGIRNATPNLPFVLNGVLTLAALALAPVALRAADRAPE